jgi:hypothetical protein
MLALTLVGARVGDLYFKFFGRDKYLTLTELSYMF